MDPLDPDLHLGTASWSSEDWLGPFYPEGMRPTDFLACYAKSFDTVEVDSTFYRAPSAWLCRKWARDTPASFRFALKVTKTITHEKALEGCEKDVEGFLAATSELGERLGFLVLQFGYFNRKSACPDLGTFLKRLGAFARLCPPRLRVVVEVRNARWVGADLLDFLRERGWIYALADQEWMPRPAELWDKFGPKLATGGAAYVRLLGERERIEQITTRWSRIVIDRTKETIEWIPVFRALLRAGVPVWAYFNNHFAGYAPGSIELLRRLWNEKP